MALLKPSLPLHTSYCTSETDIYCTSRGSLVGMDIFRVMICDYCRPLMWLIVHALSISQKAMASPVPPNTHTNTHTLFNGHNACAHTQPIPWGRLNTVCLFLWLLSWSRVFYSSNPWNGGSDDSPMHLFSMGSVCRGDFKGFLATRSPELLVQQCRGNFQKRRQRRNRQRKSALKSRSSDLFQQCRIQHVTIPKCTNMHFLNQLRFVLNCELDH